MAEKSHGRIPGSIVPIKQPAPVWSIGQERPDRFTKRAGEMSDGGVDRDDEIEALDGGSRLVEVGEERGKVGDGFGD